MQRKWQWWYPYKSPNFKLARVATNPFTNLLLLPRFNPRNAYYTSPCQKLRFSSFQVCSADCRDSPLWLSVQDYRHFS